MSPLSSRNSNIDEKWKNVVSSKCLSTLPGITMGYLNVRSLVRKLDDINVILGNSELDFLGIGESWLNDSISCAEISIPGYNLHRFDRDGGSGLRGGGGVMIYAKSNRDCDHLYEWNLCCEDVEWTWLRLNLKATRPTYIGVLYRPPSGNIDHFLNLFESKIIDILSEGPVDVVVLGDTNIDWNKPRLPNCRKYKNLCHTLGLSQLIKLPTRITLETSTLIDHILTNREDLYPRTCLLDLGISDHQLIVTSRKKLKPSKDVKFIECRSYRNFDGMAFQREIDLINWGSVYECVDVDESALLLKNLLLDVVNRHAPVISLKMRLHAPPWITGDYLAHIDEREYWSRKFTKCPCQFHLDLKQNAIFRTNILRDSLKQHYFEDQLQKCGNDMKKRWKLIRQFWPSGKSNADIKKINGKTIDVEMAEEINRFFANVGSHLAEAIPVPSQNLIDRFFNNIPVFPPSFEFKELEEYDIAVLMRDLKPTTSAGIDGLSSRILKAAGPSLFKPLKHVLNLSLRSSVFPENWKTGCVTPLFKEGDASNPSNYRPISLLPTLGKLLERVAHTQLYQHFTDHQVLSNCQSGFRKGHSTTTCLFDFLDNIYQEVDEGRLCGVLFLDLRKAFDTVDHKILLKKLQNYGIRRSSINWIESYLSNRHQITKVNNTKSSPLPVSVGVPQGSILGPLLFTIYINDLPIHLVNCKTNLYADDTALTVSGNSPNEVVHLLNNHLVRVSEWFQVNRLSLNHDKTKYMFFGTRNRVEQPADIPVKCGETEIKQVTVFKYLGVKLDSTLSFHNHVQYIKQKTIGKVKLLSRVTPFLPQHLNINLYQSLIKPHFDYCDTVYGSIGQGDAYELQKIQNMCLRNILKVPKLTPTAEIHSRTNMIHLDLARWQHTAIDMFKVYNGLHPQKVNNMFVKLSDSHDRVTRASTEPRFYPPRCKLTMSSGNLRTRGVKIWHQVPLAFRYCITLKEFKNIISTVAEIPS